MTPIAMLVLMDAPEIGAQNMGAAAGLYFTTGEIGGVLGPLSLGVLADRTGGFLAGLILLAVVSLILAGLSQVLGWVIGKPAKVAAPA